MPRHALVGASMLVVGAILLAAFGRSLGTEPPAAPVAVVASYDVRFIDQPDGSLAAVLADGRPLGTLSVAESGFTRGMMRGFARGRRQVGIAADAPYRLTRLADGRNETLRAAARITDTTTNAKFRFTLPGLLSFGGLAGQNYWVWDHDPNYDWAILALPNKSDWWIWHRDQNASAVDRARLLARARALGLDMSRVVSTGR
jgi:putative photosynthetic complex assembly protein